VESVRRPPVKPAWLAPLAAALMLAGCSAGSTPSANSAFAPLPSLAVTTNSAAPSCQDSVLSLAGPLDGWGGVSQIQQITFQVTNRGGTTCALDGYPSVRLYGSGASNYTYRYGDPTGHFQSSKPPSRVVIASPAGPVRVQRPTLTPPRYASRCRVGQALLSSPSLRGFIRCHPAPPDQAITAAP
jgi:hypothetical protein